VEDELEGEVDCEDELEGEVALWLLELLGDVLCELLEAEGADELWSDCGIDELELLLEGDVLCGLLDEGDVLCELLLEDDGLVVL
jgi:hypothetical protein